MCQEESSSPVYTLSLDSHALESAAAYIHGENLNQRLREMALLRKKRREKKTFASLIHCSRVEY